MNDPLTTLLQRKDRRITRVEDKMFALQERVAALERGKR